ncbi:PucR family transcriptional regulator [Brevibacillus sp. SYSU BS000544]|uniref:PucR family transcriptional regulator n=1 Tax=Brevibacillus sp. SYSU BS000544 TaxID=3416443 RepID=UPI003CE46E8D
MQTDYDLTVVDILKRPLFQHAQLVAGSRGINRPIRWVHILERPDFVNFLNGGELILSTGVGFGEDTQKRLTYLQDLISRKAVGLCIELGNHFPMMPGDMIELADHLGFPLIVFHQPVRFVDLTLELHEALINQHMFALRKLESYSRDIQKVTLQGQGIPKLLQHLQSEVQTQVFFMSLDGPSLFVPSMPQTVQNELIELFSSLRQSGAISEEQSGIAPIAEKKQILYQPITAMGHVLGFLGIVLYEKESNDLLQLTADYTATAMAQIFLRRMFAEERAFDEQSRLIDDLLQERYTDEDYIRSMLGIKSKQGTPRFVAVIMNLQASSLSYEDERGIPFYDLFGIFRSIMAGNGFRVLMRSKGNRLFLFLIEAKPAPALRKQVEKILKELENSTKRTLGQDVEISFGVSRPSSRYVEAKRYFREAENILENQHTFMSPFYDDLGIHRLLLTIQDGFVLESFIDDYLGPLLTHDKNYNSQLLHTLRVLLAHHGSKQEAADELFIHRQTLYHRLGKISECIGDTYLQPEHRLCLEVALVAHDWLLQQHGGSAR